MIRLRRNWLFALIAGINVRDMQYSYKKAKKVMVFGVFDPVPFAECETCLNISRNGLIKSNDLCKKCGISRLHPGHISFLDQAAGHGDELITVITRDDVVRQLKNKTPHHSEKERMLTVVEHPAVKIAVLGDFILGSYKIIKIHKPDVICLGYDQQELEADLRERMRRGELQKAALVILAAHEPDIFHTSLLTA